MGNKRLPWHSWILVCDGARALVLRNDGDAEFLQLTNVQFADRSSPFSRDLGTDRPGRVYQSYGGARSAVQEEDLHDAAEIAFLTETLEQLDCLVQEHHVKRLVIVAPPKVLGTLRRLLTPALSTVLKGEIAKDLVHLPIGEIEKHLAACPS